MSTADRPMVNRVERILHEAPGLIAEIRFEAVLERVAVLATEVIGARYSAVGMLAPDRRSLESFTVAGMTEGQQRAIGHPPTGKGILGVLIKDGRPLRLPDLARHPESAGFPLNHPPMRSFLGVPITSHQGVIGELYLTEKTGAEAFSEEDEHIAVLLALIIGTALENARLHTDRERLLEEVQQLHRSRERFFAMVNHELRNALAAVYGWAEILVRRKGQGEVPKAAYEILDSADQAVSLISDLLDLSRLDEDRLKPVFRDINAGAVVKAAVQRVTPTAEERGVRLAENVPALGPLCRTDSHRVEQIMVNLLRNAIRHGPSGSTVSVDVETAGANIILRVRDQGPGIRPENAEQVFDVYFTTAGEERTGHGLGLPLSRRLARILGGDLVVETNPGGGACFTLSIPATPSSPSPS